MELKKQSYLSLGKPFISYDHNRVSHFLGYFHSQTAGFFFFPHIKGSVLMHWHRPDTPKEETVLLIR